MQILRRIKAKLCPKDSQLPGHGHFNKMVAEGLEATAPRPTATPRTSVFLPKPSAVATHSPLHSRSCFQRTLVLVRRLLLEGMCRICMLAIWVANRFEKLMDFGA